MSNIILSAQNFDIYEADGLHPFARTGDVSCEQLFKAGAQGVIIGHSEVGDSPEVIRKKLLTIVAKQKEQGQNFLAKITLLIGDSWEEFENSSADQIVGIIGQKTSTILKNLPVEFVKNFVLCYEPKWGSFGSGKDEAPPPEPELISACVKKIKEQLENDFSQEVVKAVPVMYGGRSTPERTEQILTDKNIEGLILGSACSSIAKTLAIAKAMQRCKGQNRKILHANFKAYNLTDSYEDYIKALRKLDDSFIVYLSPPYTDIYQLKNLLLS